MHVSHSVNGVHRKSAGSVQLFHSTLPPLQQDLLSFFLSFFLNRLISAILFHVNCRVCTCLVSMGFFVTDERKTSVAVRPCLIWTHPKKKKKGFFKTQQNNVQSFGLIPPPPHQKNNKKRRSIFPSKKRLRSACQSSFSSSSSSSSSSFSFFRYVPCNMYKRTQKTKQKSKTIRNIFFAIYLCLVRSS